MPAGHNAVIAQSGGPTAVINQSLVGCLETLRNAAGIDRIFGARHGVRGMVDGDFLDLTDIEQAKLERVANTPSAALGSTRDKPDEDYCRRIVDALAQRNIRYFFYIGGNDSADTCRVVRDVAKSIGYDLRAYHIPKTIDNDLERNDHTPGYGSAARWVATALMLDNLDNIALPGIKIDVVMGRNAGFLTAASALGRRHDDDGPHLIYTPEVVFDPEDFVDDVDRIYTKLGRCLITVSEGVKDRAGNAVTAMMADTRERDPHGNIQLSGTGALGDFLAERLRQDLGARPGKSGRKLRVRADTFGYIQRSSHETSPVDRDEARQAGQEAALFAVRGEHPRNAGGDGVGGGGRSTSGAAGGSIAGGGGASGGASGGGGVESSSGSVTIERVSSDPYRVRFGLVPLEEVAAKTRVMPEEFIDRARRHVTDAFLRYARPLVGDLPEVERL